MQVPRCVELDCARPAIICGKVYRWVYETEDSPLKLVGPIELAPPIQEASEPTIFWGANAGAA